MTAAGERDFPLGIAGFHYRDLYEPARLAALLDSFGAALQADDSRLYDEYRAYHASGGAGLGVEATSDLLVRLAPHVSRFLARLFEVEDARLAQMQATRRDFDALFTFRREIVLPVAKRYRTEEMAGWDLDRLERDLSLLERTVAPEADEDADAERTLGLVAARLWNLARHYRLAASGEASGYIGAEAAYRDLRRNIEAHPQASEAFADALREAEPAAFLETLLESVQRWCFAARNDPSLQPAVANWVSFKQPRRIDFNRLVPRAEIERDGYAVLEAPPAGRRRRDGFALTDRRAREREVLYEVDHCIYCHDRDRDSCSKGMRKRDGSLRENPLGVTLTGCPLEEKISEAHVLKRNGDHIGALALIAVDNPMVAGTGHRICNDCMKGCIYQKVEPVDIPQIETNILTRVLAIPYGFEIYSLLIRWNPLNVARPCALPYNGKNVLVVGLGPAGYTLAHYLTNEGFAVAGIDGLKIEPLPAPLVGGDGQLPQAIRDFRPLYEDLDERVMSGFGGVAEYGITVRWDKNFLKVLHIILARRRLLRIYGGIRFGGTLDVDDAWRFGFDHVAIASGAGEPTVIGLENNLLRGIRKASDFLMALQLGGAAKRSSLANLQVRLPAGVIGGGLTAIDTATELVAYYPVQVEKTLERYEKLVARFGETRVRSAMDKEDSQILDEFLAHGRAVREERSRARAEQRAPDLGALVDGWGGVTLFYRKGLEDSPAYRQNHEEVVKALEEGIRIAPGMSPVKAIADEFSHLAAVVFDRLHREEGGWTGSGERLEVPLRTLCVAAGTSPNIIYEREHPGTFELDGRFYRRFEPDGGGNEAGLTAMSGPGLPKTVAPAPFTSYAEEGRRVTFFGDNHPVYAGNVVKAMASAKHGYPYIVRLLAGETGAGARAPSDESPDAFFRTLDDTLIATVSAVNRLAPTIIEVVVRAPIQARKFHPGQFYRVQNFERLAPVVEGTRLAAEGLALTGAWVDREAGLISLITLEMGSSSRLCGTWRPGQQLVVMGPTGAPTEIPTGRDVLLAGGGLGNAVLFSIGQAMRAAGNRVIYFAGYRRAEDVFKVDELEAAADVIVWSVDPGPGVAPLPVNRPQDRSFVGNIVEAIAAYGKGDLGETGLPLSEVEHLIVIGSDRMMNAVKSACAGALRPHLRNLKTTIGSINSCMQCMMKGICAQCLCKHVDPETGEESFVYSCFNQDQPLDRVDFPNLHARLRQNSVQEKLSNLWLNYLLERHAIAMLGEAGG